MDTAAAFRAVMTIDPPDACTPLQHATIDHLFGQVWPRPGLGRRERRLVTLACVAAADAQRPIESHVYAALNSGDLSVEELLEVVLQFAAYAGWPKATNLEGHVRQQWERVQRERGDDPTPLPALAGAELGPGDFDERTTLGAAAYEAITRTPAPEPTAPYLHAGVLGFVFAQVWTRPGLAVRDRRIVTIACVGVAGAPVAIGSHVAAALASGDLTRVELDELVLHFAAYSGFPKAAVLQMAVETATARLT